MFKAFYMMIDSLMRDFVGLHLFFFKTKFLDSNILLGLCE